MSNSSLPSGRQAPRQVRRLTAGGVRAVAFWAAVLLPLAYLPALHVGLVESSPGLFLALLVTNVACAVVGHEHEPGRDDEH
ncbi:hypothetical protein [Haloparvum sp. AD34]